LSLERNQQVRNTARKEVRRQAEPPRGVGTSSEFSLPQIACSVSPRLGIDLIRRANLGEIDCGLPSWTPCFLFTASASRVRWPIRRRSNCANVASTWAIASPAGV